jgi:hypothetical protein
VLAVSFGHPTGGELLSTKFVALIATPEVSHTALTAVGGAPSSLTI